MRPRGSNVRRRPPSLLPNYLLLLVLLLLHLFLFPLFLLGSALWSALSALLNLCDLAAGPRSGPDSWNRRSGEQGGPGGAAGRPPVRMKDFWSD